MILHLAIIQHGLGSSGNTVKLAAPDPLNQDLAWVDGEREGR